MIFSNQQLKNMAYRSVNLGITPQEQFILDEKKIVNGYKAKKYTLREKIGELGESLSENLRKMEIIRGKLSKEVAFKNKEKSIRIEEDIATSKQDILNKKEDIKDHIRKCQLNGDSLVSPFNIDEITSLEDFEQPKEKVKEKTRTGPKRIHYFLLYLVEVIFIFGEGVLFYNILTETHDLPVIILRSLFFIPIVFAASFLTSKRISLKWVWLPALLILGVYTILGFTVMEWFIESKALDETLTFSSFFIKNGFLILGAVMMVTLALFLTNAVKSIYSPKKTKKKAVAAVEQPKEKIPQQLDLEFKFLELRGLYKRVQKLENQLADSQLKGKEEFRRILKDVSLLEHKTEELSAAIGTHEKELETLELRSTEELGKYREHFENYSSDHGTIPWKAFDFTHL